MRLSVVTIAVVAVAALAAGCGSSSSSATSAASSSASSISNSVSSAVSSAVSNASSNAASAAGASPTFANTGNCQQLAGIGAKFAQAIQASTSGGKLNLQTAVSAYQSLASAAPSAIRPDLQLLAQTFSSFASALSKVGYTPGQVPTASQIAGIEAAGQLFNQAKLQAAEQHLSAWAHQNCG